MMSILSTKDYPTVILLFLFVVVFFNKKKGKNVGGKKQASKSYAGMMVINQYLNIGIRRII